MLGTHPSDFFSKEKSWDANGHRIPLDIEFIKTPTYLQGFDIRKEVSPYYLVLADYLIRECWFSLYGCA